MDVYGFPCIFYYKLFTGTFTVWGEVYKYMYTRVKGFYIKTMQVGLVKKTTETR